MRRQVVLPQPEGPTSATNSRSRTSRETSSTASCSRPSRRNVRDTPSKTILLMNKWGQTPFPPPEDDITDCDIINRKPGSEPEFRLFPILARTPDFDGSGNEADPALGACPAP